MAYGTESIKNTPSSLSLSVDLLFPVKVVERVCGVGGGEGKERGGGFVFYFYFITFGTCIYVCVRTVFFFLKSCVPGRCPKDSPR